MNKFEDARSTGQKEENIMGKYEQDARQLLEYVGGKENIAAVSHCVSRMRFVLNDPAKADVAKIEALKSAKGTFTQAGQFQVIIGNTVNDFYNDFIAVSGIDGVSKEAVKSAAKQNQNALQKVMSVLAEIFAPLIPAIITGGLILGFRNCIDSIYFFNNGTQTLCDISQFWSGVDSFLWLIGEAVFHMLPVCICWSVTKKMGTTQSLGIVLGLTLVSGQLLNAYAVASTAAADIPKWDFGFFTINMIGYQAQVIPAMLAAFTLVYLEKFFRKICPPVISMIVVPFCSLVLSVIVAHTILGPIGWKIGTFISDIVYAGISGSFRVIFGAIFGFVYAPLVITGLHHMSNAIDMQLIADFGGTMLWPMIALSNIAQGSAVLGMIYLQRKNADAQEVNVPSCISCYLGVTEPAMFGVNLKFHFPFICGMIGSAIAAAVCVATSTTANAIGVGGSGSGKTRFYVKPNLMQMPQKVSYVVTDPKGTIIIECGKMLSDAGYKIKVLNTINFKKSMRYNPFHYIRSEKDILKLVNTIIANTKGDGEKSGEDFWVKAERLLYCALIGYIWYEAPEEEQNFSTLLEFINASEAREDDEEFKNPVDELFEELEQKKPEHFAVRQY